MDFSIKTLFALSIIGIITGCQSTASPPTTFHECVDAGYDIWQAQPLECRTPEGKIFTIDAELSSPTPLP